MFCKSNFDKVTNLFGDVEERLVWDEILAYWPLCCGRQSHQSFCRQGSTTLSLDSAAANKHLETKKKKLLMCDVMSTFVCALSRKKQTIIYKTPCGGSGVFFQPEITSFCYKHVYAWIKSVKTKPRRRTNNYHFLSSSVCCPLGHFFLWEREKERKLLE